MSSKESTTKRSVKTIRIDRVTHDGKPIVRTSIVRNDGKVLYDELYDDIDIAVDLLTVVWERFDSDTKPGREYYGE